MVKRLLFFIFSLCLVVFFIFEQQQHSNEVVVSQQQFTIAKTEEVVTTAYFDQKKSPSSKFNEVQEVADKIMLLKKLGRENKDLSKSQAQQWHDFYFKLTQAPDEPWPIRLQAFRNLKNMRGFSTWTEREKVLQQVDKRILHLSQYSDEELLEQVVELAQNY